MLLKSHQLILLLSTEKFITFVLGQKEIRSLWIINIIYIVYMNSVDVLEVSKLTDGNSYL